jgi:hypothetical protein
MGLLTELRSVLLGVMPGATVVRTRRLRGGIATTTHLVAIEREGKRLGLVLKRYTGGMWEDFATVAVMVHRYRGAAHNCAASCVCSRAREISQSTNLRAHVHVPSSTIVTVESVR